MSRGIVYLSPCEWSYNLSTIQNCYGFLINYLHRLETHVSTCRGENTIDYHHRPCTSHVLSLEHFAVISRNGVPKSNPNHYPGRAPSVGVFIRRNSVILTFFRLSICTLRRSFSVCSGRCTRIQCKTMERETSKQTTITIFI